MKDPTASILDLLGNTSARLRPSPAKTKNRQLKNLSSELEDSEDSDDSEESEDTDEVDTPPRKRRSNRVSAASKLTKSPAVRHTSLRRRVKKEIPVSSSEDSESSSDEEDDDDDESSSTSEEEEKEEDELKIQRIIACKSETMTAWRKLCKKQNTSEVENGSRWFQESNINAAQSAIDDKKFEERFLVKWSDLSYLHCSWETQDDMKDQVGTAKTHLTNFFRKSINGYLFSADERLDGEYYDPGYVQVDRILEVIHPENVSSSKDQDWGIVLSLIHI